MPEPTNPTVTDHLVARLRDISPWSAMHDGTKFDNIYYLVNHLDVLMDGVDPYQHFLSHGKSEGRKWRALDSGNENVNTKFSPKVSSLFGSLGNQSEVLSRQSFAHLVMQSERSLEIGPFTAPLLCGEGVFYADILNTDELYERAKQLGLDQEKIPKIDYVVTANGLSAIKEKFDSVVSSHVVEHQPDLISHLNQVEELLSDGGRYFLLIPDHRYCFDHFQTRSSTIDLVNAFQERRYRHTVKALLEHWTNTTHNIAVDHWSGNHGTVTGLNSEVVARTFAYQEDENAYIDCHAWYFTPKSWTEVIFELSALGLIGFEIEFLQETQSNDLEFYSVLRKSR
jgi:predicted SAM-dependent methyltransferase